MAAGDYDDYDNDGWVDLFLTALGKNHLFQNRHGDGTFSDASAAAGIRIDNPATGQPMAKSLARAPVDLNQDGLMDVVVANDTVQNFLCHNLGRGYSKRSEPSPELASTAMGAPPEPWRSMPDTSETPATWGWRSRTLPTK